MQSKRVILANLSDRVAPDTPRELIIRKFPFRIGRRFAEAPPSPARLPLPGRSLMPNFLELTLAANDLSIDETRPPFHVSRNHLEIGLLDGNLYIRDVGSSTGTLVNDKRIGGNRNPETMMLSQEENEIVLGGLDSPWRFMLTVPAEAERRRLLVADDESVIRDLFRACFEMDYEVIEADNGRDALELVFTKNPDIVLLDWMMPELDGVQVCKTIKSDLATASIPVVMVSGKDKIMDRIAGVDAGADDYITKPVDLADLKARVAAALARSRRARDVAWLTGLPSEAAFRDEADKLLAGSSSIQCKAYDVLLILLRNLGSVQTADSALTVDLLQKQVAGIVWEESVRNERTVVGQLALAKWAVLLPADGAETAVARLSQEIREALADTTIDFELHRRSAKRCRNYFELVESL